MNTVTVTELASLDAPQLIDVREPDEWRTSHVGGARLIPLGDLADRLGELVKDRPVYVMCHSGNRSSRAAAFLDAEGYDVTNVAGGITAWQQEQLPVVVGD